MTPTEHYAEAERLLDEARESPTAGPTCAGLALLAQAHATLATCGIPGTKGPRPGPVLALQDRPGNRT